MPLFVHALVSIPVAEVREGDAHVPELGVIGTAAKTSSTVQVVG